MGDALDLQAMAMGMAGNAFPVGGGGDDDVVVGDADDDGSEEEDYLLVNEAGAPDIENGEGGVIDHHAAAEEEEEVDVDDLVLGDGGVDVVQGDMPSPEQGIDLQYYFDLLRF